MLNRHDVDTVPGGDTIQMRETRSALQALGVDVELATTDAPPNLSGFDVVHVFNWEQLDPVLSRRGGLPKNGPPITLSTIFWHHTGHWFSDAVGTRKGWRFINRRLGATRARRLYESWQEAKLRRGERGRKFRRHLSLPAQLLPNSQMEVDHLRSVFGLRRMPEGRVTVVPNGVRRDLFDPQPSADASFWREYG